MEANKTADRLRKKRTIFGWVFVTPICVFFGSSGLFTFAPQRNENGYEIEKHAEPSIGPPSAVREREPAHPPELSSPPGVSELDKAVIVSGVSLLTSLTSLLGFLSTTVLAWKREKRDALSAALDLQKKELELEKLRRELAKLEQKEGLKTPSNAAQNDAPLGVQRKGNRSD